jgi:peptidoglycan/LPS O-acetylase OafA/YrhL
MQIFFRMGRDAAGMPSIDRNVVRRICNNKLIVVLRSAKVSLENTTKSPALVGHLPSLDGMRAVSILFVIGFHAYCMRGGSTAYGRYLGRLGVYTFFVISGLLITWLMLREQEKAGQVSLKDFYIRRCLRILPVFWALLLVVSTLKIFGLLSIPWMDVLRALTFTHNYPVAPPGMQPAWYLAHTWSLSVEEQFYLLWPLVFIRLSQRAAARLAGILAVCGTVMPLIDHLIPPFRGFDGIEARGGLMMAGCAAAFVLNSPLWRTRIRRLPAGLILVASAICLLAALPAFEMGFPEGTLARKAAVTASPSLQSLTVAVVLLVLIAGKHGLAARILNLPIARHIGKLSYSLYIWQQLLLIPNSISTYRPLLWILPAAYLVALCSYYLLERPFIRLRSKYRRSIAV